MALAVISSTGLTVVSDAASNPWAMWASEEGPKIDVDTSDVKILLEDGREIPARFVLRDHDLDLAFIQPDPGDVKLPFLSLEGERTPRALRWIASAAALRRSSGQPVSFRMPSSPQETIAG